MAKLTTKATVVATTTEEIVLEPRLQTKLRKQLKEYQLLALQLKDLKVKMDRKKASIRGLREQTDYPSITLDGFTSTNVQSYKNTLDKKKFVSLGGSLKQLEGATVTTPKKPYELITCPGEEKEDGE